MDRKQGVITALAAGLGFVSTAGQAAAHCPLCTAAVGTGLITARLFGVNDIVSGIWVGAFIISIALWLDKALRRKYKPILGQGVILSVIAFLSTVIPSFDVVFSVSLDIFIHLSNYHKVINISAIPDIKN